MSTWLTTSRPRAATMARELRPIPRGLAGLRRKPSLAFGGIVTPQVLLVVEPRSAASTNRR